jgi:cell division inhibitor SepF
VGDLITDLRAATVHRNLRRVREAIADAGRDPAEVEILAAVKYLPAESLTALHAGGIRVVGENRQQALAVKQATVADLFTWDFIGALQSRKVRDLVGRVRYIHSVASDSVLVQLGRHASPQTEVLVEVNVAGEAGKGGVAPAELDDFLARCPVTVVGPRGQPPLVRRPRCPGRRTRPRPAVDGDQPGLRGRGRRGGDDHPPGHGPLRRRGIIPCRDCAQTGEPQTSHMAFRDTWHRTLVYFGLAEDTEYDSYDDEPYGEPEEELQGSYAERPNVRKLSGARRRRDEIDDIFADDPGERRTTSLRPVSTPRAAPNGRGGDVRVHFVAPKSFNDVQDVADKFKESIPVILNLQGTDTDLAKRLIDFSSGLTYAMDGGMQRIADKVFLLTPHNVEVSAEERARLVEKGFFNQS